MVGQLNGVTHSHQAKLDSSLEYDVLIVGAGQVSCFDYLDIVILMLAQSGMYSLHRMRQLGLRSKVLEAGSGEGGTWFWYYIS